MKRTKCQPRKTTGTLHVAICALNEKLRIALPFLDWYYDIYLESGMSEEKQQRAKELKSEAM